MLGMLTGCVLPWQNFYKNDPFTGGMDQEASVLLNIPLPAGLQYYPSHSRIMGGARKEGVEIWRGYVDAESAALHIYNSLKQRGWQIRLFERAGSQGVYVYEHTQELADIVFLKQGSLTIVQIWVGPRLEDGAALSAAEAAGTVIEAESPQGKQAPPAKAAPAAPESEVETWGGEEREL